jgi:hypothetical protein
MAHVPRIDIFKASKEASAIISGTKTFFSRTLHNFLDVDKRLPNGCVLLPFGEITPEWVLVSFTDPDVALEGRISLEIPIPPNSGFVTMHCSINGHDGDFLKITAVSIDEMYRVIEFCQSLMKWQDTTNLTNGVYLDCVRIPSHLVEHFNVHFGCWHLVEFVGVEDKF